MNYWYFRMLRRRSLPTTEGTGPDREYLRGRKPSDPHHSDSLSHVRSAARSAMSSRFPFAAGITGPFIVPTTSARGGGRPTLIRSRLPAGSGKRRTEWDSGGRNERHYLGRMALPRPLTQRMKK
jgi:hypothetical protein